jgi:hypothetical protein
MRTCSGCLSSNKHDDPQVIHQVQQFIERIHACTKLIRSDQTGSIPPRDHVPHRRNAPIQSGLTHEKKGCLGSGVVVVAGYEAGTSYFLPTLERRHRTRFLEQKEHLCRMATVQRIEVRHLSPSQSSQAHDIIRKRPGTLLRQQLPSFGDGGRISQ